MDIRFEKSQADFPQPFLDILLRQLAVPLELFENRVQLIAQVVKHDRRRIPSFKSKTLKLV
jgi:hypothetical protein